MKIIHLINLAIFTLVLISCSKEKNYTIIVKDGVEIIKNKNIEASPNLKLKLNLISEVSLDSLILPDSIPAIKYFERTALDNEGSIYIASVYNPIVYKFDKDGNYITSFHRKGQGPGESQIIGELKIIQDSVYVFGEYGKTFIYNRSGDLIKQYTLFEGKYGAIQIRYSENNLICYAWDIKFDWDNQKTDGVLSVYWLNLKNLEENKKILETKMNKDLKHARCFMSIDLTQCCLYKGKIYFEDMSIDKHAINVYNLKGKNIKRIEKNTRRIPFSDKFKAKINEMNEKSKNNARRIIFIADYLKQVLSMDIDKNGYLWIKPAVEGFEYDHQYYDIFNKEGVFQKRIKLPLVDSFTSLSFDKSKLITSDPVNCVVKVYDYEFLNY